MINTEITPRSKIHSLAIVSFCCRDYQSVIPAVNSEYPGEMISEADGDNQVIYIQSLIVTSSLSVAEQLLTGEYRCRLKMRNESYLGLLAGLDHKLGKYAEAEQHLTALIRCCTEARECLVLAVCLLIQMGVARFAQNDFTGAYIFIEQALNINLKRVSDMDDPYTAACYDGLSLVLLAQYDFVGAYNFLRNAFDMNLRLVGGRDHTYIVNGYQDLGEVFYQQGDYERAYDYYTKALGMVRRLLNDINHPNKHIANSYSSIAAILIAQGDYSRSLEFSKQALEMRIRIHDGRDHNDIASCYSNRAYVFRLQGDFKQAYKLYRKALDMQL